MNQPVDPAYRRSATALATTLLLLWAASLSAADLSEDVPIVGGTTAFAQSLGISPAPDAPRFVPELARLLYNIPAGNSNEIDARVQRLAIDLQLLKKLQAVLAAAQTPAGLTLSVASQKAYRNSLNDLFELIGLKLREKNRVFSVTATADKRAVERMRLLKALRIDLDQLQTKLNAGETVRVEIPVELIPVPLGAKMWSNVVFQRQVAAGDLVAAILGDRNAALLCRGLAGLDDPTLEFIQAHPALLTRLYEHDAAVFAAFSDSLRIRNGHVVPPGADAAAPLWEAVLDEKLTRPERFGRELFGNAGGRMAYLYSLIDHLDPARRAFALGLWISDSGKRVERFKALADAASSGVSEWQARERPFDRAPHDLAMWLARVRVQPDGSPVEARTRVFWSHALDASGLPDDPARQLRNLHEDGDLDAAWLVAQIGTSARERRVRFEQFTFGQRAFAGVDERQQPDALLAVRAYPRFAMLMLALERVHAAKPSTFAAAARHADRLSTLDPNHAFVALSQFQGALAIVTRLVRVHSLTPEQAETLIGVLTSTLPNNDGWYQGAIARWIHGPFAQALALREDTIDAGLESALAGPIAPAGSGVVVTWEGHRYRMDIAGAERRRLGQMREKTSRIPLSLVLRLYVIDDMLTSPSLTIAHIQKAATSLKEFPFPPTRRAIAPPGVDIPKPARESLTKSIQALSKISKPKDVKNASEAAELLGRVVDTWLADSLRSQVYAIDTGDPDRASLQGVDSSLRHDFGFTVPDGQRRGEMPWAEPGEVIVPGAPRHVRGSLLNLDLAFSHLALKQVTARRADKPPILTDNERRSFATSAVLLNPVDLRDEEREAIVEAIARGRHRVESLPEGSSSPLDQVREETAMDGWRRRAVQWSIDHHQDALPFFSLAELLQLGRPPAPDALDRWGPAAWRADSCICTRLDPMNQWFFLVGHPQLGLLATQMPDINLRIAMALHDMRLPAALTRDIVLAATQDFIDEAAPTDTDDWLSMVRAAQRMPRERIEDYVSALTAGGPLFPDEDGSPGGRP